MSRSRYPRVYLSLSDRKPRAGFAESRGDMRSNGKLLFNIRISTEAEINGTVKWVV